MEICIEDPHPRDQAPSIIEIKNKLRVGHNECCNCCCCKNPQMSGYKYVQPEKPKSFQPIRTYAKPHEKMHDATTYKLSFWPGVIPTTTPIRPVLNLTVDKGKFTEDTTHKLSYLGNWCVPPAEKIEPCRRDLFGHGPLQDKTTQKVDYPWKSTARRAPIKYRGNLCMPRGNVADDTTYKMSYYESVCAEPVKNYAPIRTYEETKAPLGEFTTYRLSFFDKEPMEKENHTWMEKPKYTQPTTKVDGRTTYKLSYWRQIPNPRKPIRPDAHNNLIGRDCCFDDKTTYSLSYFGGDGDKPVPFAPTLNKIFDDKPLTHHTVNRMSYLGNWCPEPEKPIKPCTRQLLGRGPMPSSTTQKKDFTWKCIKPNPAIRPENNLAFSPMPLDSCTTNQLSYLPNCVDYQMPNKSFAPIREHQKPTIPMAGDTTMQLSYQQVPPPEKMDMPWAAKVPYHKPTTDIDDNTTYGLSYIPPGTLIPVCPENVPSCPYPPQASQSCSTSMSPAQVSVKDTRPCISC